MPDAFRLAHAWRMSAVLFAVSACAPASLIDVQSPSTVVDPAQVATPGTAIQMHTAAVIRFAYPLAGNNGASTVIAESGIFTDELQSATDNRGVAVDSRLLSLPANNASPSALYQGIHQARVQAQQARQALQLYAPNPASAPTAWQGQLLALEGYTVLWFAELFCSGIPLSVAPLVGPKQLTAGYTTQELYARAIALFDSAIIAGADSAQFVNLASVGKGRALLGLGQFAAADSAVQNVPTSFVYLVQFATSGGGYSNLLATNPGNIIYRAQDREGGNGLVWSADPRTAIVTLPAQAGAMLWPSKYYATAAGTLDPNTAERGAPVRLADGLEARLIHTEVALALGSPDWLATLNTLRATCIGTATCAPVPGLTAAALPPLVDPGTANARLDLLMKERAMWLYMTGHREGDLRRLAHVYLRDPLTLWPTGIVSSPAFFPLIKVPAANDGTLYGTDVVFPPSADEQLNNPQYGGCYDRNP